MSETDTEIAWRSTVQDARAYMRGNFFSPADGTLAHEIQEYARDRMAAACAAAYRAGSNRHNLASMDWVDGIPYIMVGAAIAFFISAVM